MGLRERASADVRSIVSNRDDWGWDVTVTDPSGNSAPLIALQNDISQIIDPDTGQALSGRLASVALNISDLADAGLGIPRGVADETSKPWVVSFADLRGNTHTFKVQETSPDRTVDLVLCYLEQYTP